MIPHGRLLARTAAGGLLLVSTAILISPTVATPFRVVHGDGVGRVATAASATNLRPTPGIACHPVLSSRVNYVCVIGHSAQGRSIVAMRQGNPSARRVLVVNGQMHGEEWPGPLTVDALRGLAISPHAGFQIWTIRTINPDGGRLGHRFTSRGIDLNGNFPLKFARLAHTGPHALSEPESVAMARFLAWLQPNLVISLHGFSQAVDTTGGGTRAAAARRFSVLSNITPAHPVPCGGPCHGNMTDWYTATSRVRGVAFTVEMPHTSRQVRRCGVPGHRKATPILCAAWAAVIMAARLLP